MKSRFKMASLRSCRLLAFALSITAAFAQDYRAKVQGIVTDTSDATVAGATVRLLNTGTGVSAVRTTGLNGAYLFDNVEPGTYTVSAELQGFSRQIREAVLVQTRADLTVDFKLNPGAVVETVTVNATAPALQFNTSTRELTIDRKMLLDLPVKARNPFTLALLDPAVVNRYTAADRNPFYMWSSSQIDVGGSTTMKNDLLLDGAPIQLGPKGSYSPPMDAVQEFSVQQNSVDAEFGHSAGGVMSVSVKSGTNEIHGTAYYFGRNPAFNAVQNPITRTKNFTRNHIWGGTAGGPVRKNKLFTFFAYEAWRMKSPNTAMMTLPTSLERAGDFSQTLNRSGARITIYDPTTTVLNVATNTSSRTPFPGNVIPSTRMDAPAKKMMADIWSPNNAGDDLSGSNNFKASYAWPVRNWNLTNRTDWNAGDRLKVFGRYSVFKTVLDQDNYAPNQSRAMTNDNGGAMDAYNAAGDLVYTASPQTVINLRGSYSLTHDDYSAPKYAVGEKGLAEFWPNNPWYKSYLENVPAIYYPQLTMAGLGSRSFTFGKANYWIGHPNQYALSGKVSHARGSHYLKAGAEYRKFISEGIYPNLMNFYFSQANTADSYLKPNTNVSGNTWASFLLGTFDSGSTAVSKYPYQSMRYPYIGGFVHDDWKLSRRVTVNLGLRYEWESGPYDANDQFSRYLDLTVPNTLMQKNPPNMPADVLALHTPTYNGAWIFADSNHRKAYVTQKDILLPRAGVAIRLCDKTALNIGFGRYVALGSMQANTMSRTNYFSGFSAISTPLAAVEGRPQAYLSDPFPSGTNPLQATVGKGYGVYTNLGNSVRFVDQNYRAQINDRINVGIKTEIPFHFTVDATWFMNVGRHVQHDNVDENLGDPNLYYTYKANLAVSVANPFYDYLTMETFPGSQRNSARVTKWSLLRPYPQYGAIYVNQVGDWRSRYQALQLRVQRTYASGGSLLIAYNYNQDRSEAYFNDVQQYANQVFWLGSSNPRHRLSIAGSYELPIGRGRKLGSGMHPVLEAVVGGWQLNGIYTFRSGAFLTFPKAAVTGNPVISNPGASKWFNTEAFSIPDTYTPRYNPYIYPEITGPMFWNVDGTVSKKFRITDKYALQFAFEAYNLTNSFMWADPNMTVGSPTFGRSTAQAAGNQGREMQYTLRFTF